VNFSFLPGEVKFYDYFEEATQNLLEAAKRLDTLMGDFHDVDEAVAQITEIEHRGDFIVHEVTNLLPRTLITPIDTEDIKGLISAIDDALDTLEATTIRLSIYQITDVRKPAIRLARLILEGATELDVAIHGIRDKKQYEQVREPIVQINTIENNSDRVLQEGLRSLVSHKDDMFEFMRWKEIYELLEECTDKLEDAGDVIQRVMIANS
jgi:uncharacterized protein